MSRYLKYFWLVCLGCFFPLNVYADICNDEKYLSLKESVKNIEVHYEYLDLDDDSSIPDEISEYGYNYVITVSGMRENIYFISKGIVQKKFDYSDSKDGVVTYYIENLDGDLILKFYSKECYFSIPLRSINLELPIPNDYYYTTECEEIRDRGINIPICQKTISKEEKNKNQKFYDIVGLYLNDTDKNSADNFWNWINYLFYKPYFVILVIFVIILFLEIVGYFIYHFIKRRRLE